MKIPPGGFWGAGTTPDRRAGLGDYQTPVDLGDEPILRADFYTTADDGGGSWCWLVLLAAGLGYAAFKKKER